MRMQKSDRLSYRQLHVLQFFDHHQSSLFLQLKPNLLFSPLLQLMLNLSHNPRCPLTIYTSFRIHNIKHSRGLVFYHSQLLLVHRFDHLLSSSNQEIRSLLSSIGTVCRSPNACETDEQLCFFYCLQQVIASKVFESFLFQRV